MTNDNSPIKPDAGEEPFFLTEEIEAELKAAGDYKIEVPEQICTVSIRELYDWQPGETLAQAIARKAATPPGD